MTYTYTFKDTRYGETTMRAQSETPLHSLEKKNLDLAFRRWCKDQANKGRQVPERLEGVVKYSDYINADGRMHSFYLVTNEGEWVGHLAYAGKTRLKD